MKWLIQITDGLNQAHTAGIIHCDLKLDNIIMAGDTPKIGDFGIAQARREHKEKPDNTGVTTHVSGSYLSISPEQAQGLPIDFRTDVFSLGVLAYQVLTGRHPFGESRDSSEMLDRIINQPFTFSAADQQELPAELRQLISRMLEKRPDERPADTAKIATQFRQCLAALEDGGQGDDPTTIIETREPARRLSARPLIAGGFVLVLLAVAATTFLHFYATTPQPLSVAVVTPVLSSASGFDQTQQRQISATIKMSLQESLLNINGLSLNPASDTSLFNDDISRFAQAVAADAVLKAEADCDQSRCRISLQRLSGQDGSVAQQQNWPVVASSMSDIRATIQAQLPMLFSERTAGFAHSVVGEKAYRRYLSLYLNSHSDLEMTPSYLAELDDLQTEVPNFIPLYELYARLALDYVDRTGNTQTLDKLKSFLGRAPTVIRDRPVLKQLAFRQVLKKGDLEKAAELIEEMKSLNFDRVLVNDSQALLDYQAGNYDQAVELERESALLQPSYTRYYNLAATEFTLGNMELAGEAARKTLSLVPEDPDALNLVAAIELIRGNLDQAAELYLALVKQNPDSYSYLNLGVTLMLQGRYTESIKYIQTATEMNPTNPEYQLNLAGQLQPG